MKLKIRGSEVDIVGKTIFVEIRKPTKNKFSLNDQIVEKLKIGFDVVVTIRNQKQRVTVDTPILFKEDVPTKFPGMPNWSRYWYEMKDYGPTLFDQQQERA